MNNELKMGIEDLATLLTSKLEDRHPTLPDHSFSTTVGRKYTKILDPRGGVWGFVVMTTDDEKFEQGDILKPASWSSPTRNFARGNVLHTKPVGGGLVYGL